ncbi:Serine/threonine-protein kinase [Coemansia sp. RSA 552]|nr:Serine/threonine-protein kinase [Coemansia sp. RSA 552]
MKTVLCALEGEGQVVVHVFMRPVSAAVDVDGQMAATRAVYERLANLRRVVWRTLVAGTMQAVYVVRQRLHNNLYDRLSTRPFLSGNEKRWVVWQILEALREAHGRGVCHGDVKSENVVMTSWNLVYLADFAPFKPAYLAADDPAEYNFYFDTAGRQSCCVAPERFYESGSDVARRLAQGDEAGLQPAMDVFSAGCVIGEMLCDGNPLFSLGRLLQYRRGSESSEAVVGHIRDAEMARLVAHMIQRDPQARLSAGEYQEQWASSFPQVPPAAYMDTSTADERMAALEAETMDQGISAAAAEITAGVASAAARNCRWAAGRSAAIRVLRQSATAGALGLTGDADVVLPCLVALGSDASARVRAEAVAAVGAVVGGLRRLTPINANLFADYVGPHVQVLAADSSVAVRCAVAAAMGDISDAAGATEGALSEAPLRAAVARLSFDASAAVRHVLLCAFPQLHGRGVQTLAHVITYLNDRESWFLRAAFFDVVFAAAAQISRHAAREYVVPLVNLGDPEPFVVISALRALVRLVPQMTPAMRWDRLAEAHAACAKRRPLRRGAREFEAFVLKHASLPMAADHAQLALEIDHSREPEASGRGVDYQQSEDQGDEPSQTHGSTIPVKTVFLTPLRDPWAAAEEAGGAGVDSGAAAAFLRRKARELDPPQARGATGWRGSGTLVGEVAAHSAAVTCAAAVGAAQFVTGSADGTVRLADTAGRALATHTLGGRVTGLVSLGSCVVASAANGAIHVLQVHGKELRRVAATELAGGEYAVGVAAARGVVVAATTGSRVVFLRGRDLGVAGSVRLDARRGRATAVAARGSVAVVGTGRGWLHVIDVRFGVVVRTEGRGRWAVTALAMADSETAVVADAAGDVAVVDMRHRRWPVCVSARSPADVKAGHRARRQRVNCIVRAAPGFITGSNDALVRFCDPARPDRSFAVNAPAAPPYASLRLDGTVYYCENPAAPAAPASAVQRAVAANGARPAGPVTALALLPPPRALLVVGLQSGSIRLFA